MIKIILTLLSFSVNCLPRKALLFLGSVLGLAWYYLFPFRKKIVQQNLSLAFPRLSSVELHELSRANYKHYGNVLVESLASITWSKKQYLERVAVEGLEYIEAVKASGRGAFFLTAHLGNWELAIGSTAAAGIEMDVVVKQSRSASAEALLQWYRKRTGVGIFLESGTAKDILRSLSRGRFVAFILDQFMGPPIGLPVRFFGKTAGTAVALALLTEKNDVPVLPAYSYRDNAGQLHTVFERPVAYGTLASGKEERLYQKTQVYNDVLEARIRKYPDQWLWLHRRWKPYRGEPRWKLSNLVFVSVLGMVFYLAGCSSPGAAPTGISLPPDPSIVTPQFKPPPEEDEFAEEESEATAVPAAKPVIITSPQLKNVYKSKVRSRVKPKQKKAEKVPEPFAAAMAFNAIRPDRIPFEVGERLEISLNWTALPAGRAVLEVRDGPVIGNRPTYQLWANVLSSRLVDAIYHVDNTIESFVDKGGLIPYKFLLHMVETAQKKETRVAFDHPHKKAFYWSNRISQKWGNEIKDRTDELIPGSRDMWGGLYMARTLNYKMNEAINMDVYENGKAYKVQILPMGNELITGEVGTFQCIKLKVIVNLNNVLAPTGDMFLWLSDDSKRYIVRFDAKLKIGVLRGSLVSIRDHL